MTTIYQIYGFQISRLDLYQWILEHPDSQLFKIANKFFQQYKKLNLDIVVKYMKNEDMDDDDDSDSPEDVIDSLPDVFECSDCGDFSIFILNENICNNRDFIVGYVEETVGFDYLRVNPDDGRPMGRVVRPTTTEREIQHQKFIATEVYKMSNQFKSYWVQKDE
jgi:hypothetical protein